MEQTLPKIAYFIDATEVTFPASYFEVSSVKSAKSAVNYFLEKQSLGYSDSQNKYSFTTEVAPNILGATISYLNKIKKPVKVVVESTDTIYLYLNNINKLFSISAEETKHWQSFGKTNLEELKKSIDTHTIIKLENMCSYFYNMTAYKYRKDKQNTEHVFDSKITIAENLNIFFDKIKKFEIGEGL